MPDRIVYDEPSARRHRVAGLAPAPDTQRPGWQDPRVIAARCGLVIALVGNAEHRPPRLTSCVGCGGG